MIYGKFNIESLIIYLIGIFGTTVLAYGYEKFSFHKKNTHLIWKVFIISTPMSLVLGLRSMTVGYDTFAYCYYYLERLESMPEHEFIFTGTIRLMNYFLGGTNYTPMLLIFAYSNFFLSIYAIEKIEEEHSVDFYALSYSLIFGLCITDQFRQLLACALFAISIIEYEQGKRLKSLFFFIWGIGNHFTIIIPTIVYWVCSKVENFHGSEIDIALQRTTRIRIKTKTLFFIGLVLFFLYLFFKSTKLIEILIWVLPGEYYTGYLTSKLIREAIGFGWLIEASIIFPLFFSHKYCKTQFERTLFLFALFVPVFRLTGYMSYFLMRLMYYPMIMVVVLYSILMKKRNVSKLWKNFTLLICIAFFVIKYIIYNEHGAFPYSFYSK